MVGGRINVWCFRGDGDLEWEGEGETLIRWWFSQSA